MQIFIYTKEPDCFWTEKFQKNVRRDEQVRFELAEKGVKMLIVWECTVKQMMKDVEKATRVLDQIEEFMISDEAWKEF